MFFQENVLWLVVESGCEKVAFLGFGYLPGRQTEIREDSIFRGLCWYSYVHTQNVVLVVITQDISILMKCLGLRFQITFFDLIGNADRIFTPLEGMTE